MIYTIGHSTHQAETFLKLLTGHGVLQIADVRSHPSSRRHPQFEGNRLARFLGEHGIGYRHFPALGGLRKPRPDSINTAWRHDSFRGYADHMQSAAFAEALESLIEHAERAQTAIMCAEALWWRCHRRLLADALFVRRVAVWHIMPGGPAKSHELSEFARSERGKVFYPGLL